MRIFCSLSCEIKLFKRLNILPKAKRVHEIAKELGMTDAEVIDLCRKIGIGVKGPSSTMIDAQADRIRARAERESLMRDTQSEETQYATVRNSQGESVAPATMKPSKKVHANLIIFDLDGTLANTESLESGRREPWQIIAPGVNSTGHSLCLKNWGFGTLVTETPARLIERGHVVIVATSSPLAYASTLLHILGIDYHELFASCGAGMTKSSTLIRICDTYKFERNDAVYVGDLPVDADCARAAGMGFISASELHSSSNPENLFAMSSLKITSFPTAKSDEELRQIRARLEKMKSESKGLFNSAWYSPTIEVLLELHPAFPGNFDTHIPTLLFRLRDVVTTANNSVAMGVINTGDSTKSFERTLLELDGMQQVGFTYDDQIRQYIVTLWFLGLRSRLVRDPTVRRQIQMCLFKNLTENDGQQLFRISDGFLGLPPSVITRRELRSDEVLRREYLSALKRAWPNLVGSGDSRLQGVFNFRTDQLGKILMKLKDYGRKPGAGDRFRSGPEVRLGYLDFVSDLVASRIDRAQNYPIVPIPTAAPTELQPGQISIRLARLVADAVGREIVPLLQRDGDMLSLNKQESKKLRIGATVDLVEDQITTGGTVQKCQQLLHEAGFTVNHCYAYSGNPNNWIKTHERPKLGFTDWWDELSSFFL